MESVLLSGMLLLVCASVLGQQPIHTAEEMQRLHRQATEGIKILPGQWRPHYAFEQIAWVRPPWGGEEYIWLDFPEAIFTDHGLLYLSHFNPDIVSVFTELPATPWRMRDDGIAFDRVLPNGVKFGGCVRQTENYKVDLYLYLENGMSEPLRNITLQTCAFLHGIKEFSELTRDNKFVYVRDVGWTPFEKARDEFTPKGKYKLGWRRGPEVADWPIMIVRAKKQNRWFGMTWYLDTLSLVGNKWHPCPVSYTHLTLPTKRIV